MHINHIEIVGNRYAEKIISFKERIKYEQTYKKSQS